MKDYLQKLMRRENLTRAEMETVAELLSTGQLNESQSAAFLVALAMKGETVEEIVGLVSVLRRHMVPVVTNEPVVDTCGTGGDGASVINVSTAAAFIVAALGVKVAKHGNRSISSKCGSMDVLEMLGVNIQCSPEKIAACIKEIGIGFMFAPNFHPAFKYITPARKALGVRTVFNFLGPLLNPAGATRQLIGVSNRTMAEKLGTTLMELGAEKIMLVHGTDGLDEISVAAPTEAFEFALGKPMQTYTITPDIKFPLAMVAGGEPKENALIVENILKGKGSEAENEFVALNAAGALVVADAAPDFKSALQMARETINSGRGFEVLKKVITFTNAV